MLRFTLGVSLVALFACTPREDSADSLAGQVRAQQIDNAEIRTQVRQAARNHILKHAKDCEIQGFSFSTMFGADYIVGVDCAVGADRRTIELSVDLFAREDGQLYWKTGVLVPRQESRPLEFATEPYRRVKRR